MNGTAALEPSVIPLDIPYLQIKQVTMKIVGDSSLITHAWAEKAKTQMRDKQTKRASVGKEIRNPEADFKAACYVIDPSIPTYGFPAIGFKAAAVNAALQVDAKKTSTRIAFHVVNGVKTPQGDIIPIRYDKLIMREDMVRINMGAADLRYRPEFTNWSCDLAIRYNSRAISLEQLVTLFNAAGFGVGVGEWRPQKNGMNGTFHVADITDGE